MKKATSELSGREVYQLMVDSIVPRPIAWVTTVAPDGVLNLAPFSFFSGVTARPPILSIAISSKAIEDDDGQRIFRPKDTTRNIVKRGEFVVHLAPAGLRSQVDASSENHPPGTDVAAALGLETVPGEWVSVPRLRDAPIAMECQLETVVEVGTPSTHLILAEVMGWHVEDRLIDDEGRIWADRWGPLGRLGVDRYSS